MEQNTTGDWTPEEPNPEISLPDTFLESRTIYEIIEKHVVPINQCGIVGEPRISVYLSREKQECETHICQVVLTYEDFDNILYATRGLEAEWYPEEVPLAFKDCVFLSTKVKGRYCSNIERVSLENCVILEDVEGTMDGQDICRMCKNGAFLRMEMDRLKFDLFEETQRSPVRSPFRLRAESPCENAGLCFSPTTTGDRKVYSVPRGKLIDFKGLEPVLLTEGLDTPEVEG